MSDFPQPDPALGVFETLLVVDGAPIELQAHLDRLNGSVRELFGATLPQGMRELMFERAAPLALGRLRLTLAPGSGRALTAQVVTAPVDPTTVFPAWEQAVVLRPLVIPGGLGAHKWADRSGLSTVESSEADDCLRLLLDVGDEVLEASRANVFAVEGDLLITPAADGRILPGVTRARTIEAICSLGLELREEALTVERMIAAGEAFLTGAVRGIEPVRSIGDVELAPPGETVFAISDALKRAWIGPHVSGPVAAR